MTTPARPWALQVYLFPTAEQKSNGSKAGRTTKAQNASARVHNLQNEPGAPHNRQRAPKGIHAGHTIALGRAKKDCANALHGLDQRPSSLTMVPSVRLTRQPRRQG